MKKRLLILCIPLIVLLGCSNALNEVEKEFYAGDYVEGLQIALESLKDPGMRPEIEKYMQSNGASVLERALYKGESLAKDPTNPKAVAYYQKLAEIINQIEHEGFNVQNLNSIKRQVTEKERTIRMNYNKVHYDWGLRAYNKGLYRKCMEHMKLINKFTVNYEDMARYTKQSFDQAQRYISIAPFYKKIDDILSDINYSADSLVVDNVDITKELTKSVFKKFKTDASIFMHFSVDNPSDDIKRTQYYIEGAVDVNVHDTVQNAEHERVVDTFLYRTAQHDAELKEQHFEYDLFTFRYKVTLHVEASVYLTGTDEKVFGIEFEETSEQKAQYRSRAIGVPSYITDIRYPNRFLQISKRIPQVSKGNVVKNVISLAAEHLAQDVLNEFERDLDPYAIYF